MAAKKSHPEFAGKTRKQGPSWGMLRVNNSKDKSQEGFLCMQYDTDTQLAQESSEVSQKLAFDLSRLLAPLLAALKQVEQCSHRAVFVAAC